MIKNHAPVRGGQCFCRHSAGHQGHGPMVRFSGASRVRRSAGGRPTLHGGAKTLVRRPWTASLSRSGIAACSRGGSLPHCCKAQARRGRPSARAEGSRCRYGTLCRSPGACCHGEWSIPMFCGAIPYFPGIRQAPALPLPLQRLFGRFPCPGEHLAKENKNPIPSMLVHGRVWNMTGPGKACRFMKRYGMPCSWTSIASPATGGWN